MHDCFVRDNLFQDVARCFFELLLNPTSRIVYLRVGLLHGCCSDILSYLSLFTYYPGFKSFIEHCHSCILYLEDSLTQQ